MSGKNRRFDNIETLFDLESLSVAWVAIGYSYFRWGSLRLALVHPCPTASCLFLILIYLSTCLKSTSPSDLLTVQSWLRYPTLTSLHLAFTSFSSPASSRLFLSVPTTCNTAGNSLCLVPCCCLLP